MKKNTEIKPIEIERFEQTKVDVFFKGEYYGTFNNEHELDLFRIKLVENRCTELYHIVFKDEKITFNEIGELSNWPRGMYDETQRNYAKLFQLRKQIKNEKGNIKH